MNNKRFRSILSYNETAEGYDKRYKEIQFAKYREVLVELEIHHSDIILDIGGGTGLIIDFNKEFIQNSVICDLSFEMLKAGKKKHKRGYFICADSEELPFRNNCSDITCLFSILQNLEKPDKTLLESKRVLKNDGKIIITALSKIFDQNILENTLINLKFSISRNWLLSVEDLAIIGKRNEN